MKHSISALLLLSGIISSHLLLAQSQYKIANRIQVSGDGGWDYINLDDAAGRLYVSHGTVVQVVDIKTKAVVGTIPDTKGVHGIALAKELNKGFTSNGKDSSVTVFSLDKVATLNKIKVTGNNPDAILYDVFTQRVFTFNGKSSNATVIDAKTDKVIGTIVLEGKPEFSVSDGRGKIYVNLEDKSKICMINPSTLKVEQTWSVAPGEEPSGLAIDVKNNRLFTVCDNKLMVVLDAQTGRIITSLPIGGHVDGVAFDPELKRAYSSNGEGSLTVVQEESDGKYKVLENVLTQKGAKTVVLDTKTHHIYLPTAEYGPAPEPTKENPKPRPTIKPNTFTVLEIAPL